MLFPLLSALLALYKTLNCLCCATRIMQHSTVCCIFVDWCQAAGSKACHGHANPFTSRMAAAFIVKVQDWAVGGPELQRRNRQHQCSKHAVRWPASGSDRNSNCWP